MASVINLAERTDRWDTFQNAWKQTSLNFDRTDAHKAEDTDGVYKAVFRKHRELIEDAHAKGQKYLLVLEDDAVPSAEFDDRWKTMQSVLHSFDAWDVFNGGCLAIHDKVERIYTVKDSRLKTLLLDIKQGCMAQFLYFHVENMYEKMKLWEEKDCPAFDSWYCGDDFQTLACVPFLATQSDGFSNAQDGAREWSERFIAEEAGLLHNLREFLED
jgi:GR25 family glycosyltransferase involved in LPS biosynthesis